MNVTAKEQVEEREASEIVSEAGKERGMQGGRKGERRLRDEGKGESRATHSEYQMHIATH